VVHVWWSFNSLVFKYTNSSVDVMHVQITLGKVGLIQICTCGDMDPDLNIVPWAHPTQLSKWHLDQFCSFCTTHGRGSLYFTINHPFLHENCPFVAVSGPRLISASLANWNPQPKQHLGQFRRLCAAHRRESLYFWAAHYPVRIASLHWGIWTPV